MSDDKKPWEGETPPGNPDDNKPDPIDKVTGAPNVDNPTPADPPEQSKEDVPIKVAKGDQAPLSLINLVSSGMSMKNAKKQLGMK